MKNFVKQAFLTISAFMFSLSLFGGVAHAALPANCEKGSFLGLPRWYEYLELDPDTCKIIGPSKEAIDSEGNAITYDDGRVKTEVDIAKAAPLVFLAVIDILLRVAGMAAFVYIIISGFKFVTAQGSPDKEKAARQTIINAAIGLVISIVAIGLVTAVGNFLGN